MNFLNRAIKNVTRKLSKTILLIITFFVIGNFVIIGLSVSKASESAKTLTRQKMRAVVKYELDYDAIWRYGDSIEDEDEQEEFYNNYPSVKLKDVQELIKDDRVKTANVNTSNIIYQVPNGIDYVHLNNEYEENNYGGSEGCYIDDDGQEVCEYVEGTFFAKCNFFPSMIEFEEGTYTIADGRFYSQEEIDNGSNVVLISSALASQNGLKVGDKVKFMCEGYYSDLKLAGVTYDDITMELEIIGIFDHYSPVTPDNPQYDYLAPYENLDNMVLMPGTTLNLAKLDASLKVWDYYATNEPDYEYYQNPDNKPSKEKVLDADLYDVTLLLNDPLVVDDFVKDYEGKVGEFKKITADNEEFEKLSKPLDTLTDYATFIIWLVVINAIVIITLVTALTLKTREYEIGVLLSIGATKFKVVLQFFVELALVAIVGFTLAVGSGAAISNKVGAALLENQIQSAGLNEEDEYDYYSNYTSVWDSDYTTEVSLEDILEEYDVTVSPIIIVEIYVVGLAIVFISVIIPSIMIMRFNPKKILMNQQ